MEDLPKTSLECNKLAPNIARVVKQVETATISLAELAQKEGVDMGVLVKIWANLPLDESQGMTYLEMAGQCILEVSGAVDKAFPGLSYEEKIIKKFELMAGLLLLKAEQVKQIR